jgi:uncharacterized protein YbjQ (UPF0145 family)
MGMDDAGITEVGGGQDPAWGLLVSTMNDVPGYRIERVIGEVFGSTVRTRNLGSQIGSALKSIVGGELRGQTKAVVASRSHALERMLDQARARGANAVIMMRYDGSEAFEGATELCAYGTAVVIVPDGVLGASA